MLQDYEKLFSHIQPLEPPVGLFERIMNRIQIERKLITVKRRVFLFSAGLFLTILAFIPAIKMAWSGLTESGFLNFFSLIFSNTTQISKSAAGSLADLKVGESITVNGSTNSDGSITAQIIQLRPADVNPAVK